MVVVFFSPRRYLCLKNYCKFKWFLSGSYADWFHLVNYKELLRLLVWFPTCERFLFKKCSWLEGDVKILFFKSQQALHHLWQVAVTSCLELYILSLNWVESEFFSLLLGVDSCNLIDSCCIIAVTVSQFLMFRIVCVYVYVCVW